MANCKVGDIAVIVRVLHPDMEPNLGGWVRIDAPGPSTEQGPSWALTTMSTMTNGYGKYFPPGWKAHCQDVCLQPIRPPKPPEELPAPPVELEKETI